MASSGSLHHRSSINRLDNKKISFVNMEAVMFLYFGEGFSFITLFEARVNTTGSK
jgi:hypothetical protein